jgi:site-specific DNA-methyltransferase (adenine-specific)
MCDDPTDEVYRVHARNAGFWVWKSITWVKTKVDIEDLADLEEADVRAGMGYHWRASKENILFLEKRSRPQVCHSDWTVRKDPTGKGRQLNFKGWPDVLPHPPVRDGYPTEKPVPLLERLIQNSSNRGEIVLDPFMGSGSTGEAALINQREFLGGDIGQEAYDVTTARLLAAGGERF